MMVIVLALTLYFTKYISLRKMIAYLFQANVISILAELKAVFVVEAGLIFVFAFINMDFDIRSIKKYILIVICTLLCIYSSAELLAKLYPEFDNFLSLDVLIRSISNDKGYGYGGYIDRMNFIPVVNQHLFNNDFVSGMFGIGLGAAEYSSVDFLCSDFYRSYGQTYSYLNFSSSSIYVETGIVGLLLFVYSYVSMGITSFMRVKQARKTANREKLLYELIGLGSVLISLLYIFYNNLHRTDMAVILAFFCAVPIVVEAESRTA